MRFPQSAAAATLGCHNTLFCPCRWNRERTWDIFRAFLAVGGERFYMYPTPPAASKATHQIRAHIDVLTSTAG